MPYSDAHFLRAELITGITRCRIALQARQEEKRQRNRVNARKAYDAILQYKPKSSLTASETAEIDSRLSELRALLLNLGETL